MVKLTKHERHIRYQVEDGLLYDVYSTIREEKANPILYTRFPDKEILDDLDIAMLQTMITQDTKRGYDISRLDNLQAELGYVQGDISTVAMLGLVGEAGEVLGEVDFEHHKDYALMEHYVNEAEVTCALLEDYKKSIRRNGDVVKVYPILGREEFLKKELADTFYYLNILATNLGLTIYDLATMAHDKVRAKQAAGGSSEDPKS